MGRKSKAIKRASRATRRQASVSGSLGGVKRKQSDRAVHQESEDADYFRSSSGSLPRASKPKKLG